MIIGENNPLNLTFTKTLLFRFNLKFEPYPHLVFIIPVIILCLDSIKLASYNGKIL